MCGPKPSTKLDERSFGFPFDRKMNFILNEKRMYQYSNKHKHISNDLYTFFFTVLSEETK